jgi:hypothetical protein
MMANDGSSNLSSYDQAAPSGSFANRLGEHRLDESDLAFLDLQDDDVTAQKGDAQQSLRLIPPPLIIDFRFWNRDDLTREFSPSVPQRTESSNA